MPTISDYKCNKCGFTLPTGWGGYLYVLDDSGNRIPCLHPGEMPQIIDVLGKDVSGETIHERTGFNSHCLCLDCLHQFDADFKMKNWLYDGPYLWNTSQKRKRSGDKRECPECGSNRVRTEIELVGTLCPKCKTGIVKEIYTGS
jgi:hypothetical protein